MNTRILPHSLPINALLLLLLCNALVACGQPTSVLAPSPVEIDPSSTHDQVRSGPSTLSNASPADHREEIPGHLVDACVGAPDNVLGGGPCLGAAHWVAENLSRAENACIATNSLDAKAQQVNSFLYLQTIVQLLDLGASLPELNVLLDDWCGGLFNERVTYVSLDPSEARLGIDDTLQLTPTIHCGGETCTGTLSWGTNRPDIATVTGTGVVTGHGTGVAIIGVFSQSLPDITGTASISVDDEIQGIQLTPASALLRNDGTELPLMWEFVSADGTTPLTPPDGVTVTWTVNSPGILTAEPQDLQHAVLKGVAPGRATVTVLVTYSGRTLQAPATIDVFEEGIYRFSSSSITATGESSGEVWRCADNACAWVPFSCTFRVDTIFDPASAVRVVTRPRDDYNNNTSVVLDGGLGGGSTLLITVNEVGHELFRQGPACLAPQNIQSAVVPVATRITPFGAPIYPMSGMGLVWVSGTTSHVTSWIGGAEGSGTSVTQVGKSWPVDVTYESLIVRTERSWSFALEGSGELYRALRWSSQVTGEFRLVRER